MKRTALVGLLSGVALATASPAGAATVSVQYAPVVHVEAAPGETNEFTVQFGFKTSDAILVRDDGGAPLHAEGPQCVSLTTKAAVCIRESPVAQPFLGVEVYAGDGNDRMRSTGGSVTFYGGDGDDFATAEAAGFAPTTGLFGEGGNDVLKGGDVGITGLLGGDGNDELDSGGRSAMFGGAGDDILNGGSGWDGMDGGPGADVINGGGNNGSEWTTRDSINYRDRTGGVSVTTDGLPNDGSPGEHDNVGSDVEVIFGSPGNDVISTTAQLPVVQSFEGDDVITLDTTPGLVWAGPGTNTVYGSTADDDISGDNGNDTIDGRGGHDVLWGYGGDDLLLARDGVADDVHCGDGSDRAQLDAGLDNPFDCELSLP